MKLLNTILMCLTTGLALLTAAAPTVGDDDVVPYEYSNVTTADCCDWTPTLSHHGFATVEVWVGRPAINAGFLKGLDMNAAVWNILGHLCPDKRGWCDENSPGRCVDVEYVSRLNPFPVELKSTTLCMWVHAKWENEAIRQLLINTVSAALMGFTDDAYYNPNCYEYPATGRHLCNIPDGVRVNLPPLNGEKGTHINYMHVHMGGGGTIRHEFHCCETRDKVDKQLDLLYDRMTTVFHEDYGKFRLTQCMVRGWMTCEQCCETFDCNKCNKCGLHCIKLD